MAAYLYAWNPERWDWSDLQDAIYRINNDEPYDSEWSCGNTKRIEVGDVFLLMRLGVEPKGIVGCGYISSRPSPSLHWDEEKANKGKAALRTDLLFKSLSEKPLIPLEALQTNYPSYDWTPRSSGVAIPSEIANALFAKIQADQQSGFTPATTEEIKLYMEGRPKQVTYRTYDRSSAARQDCIAHYGYNCSACGFNFERHYGDQGARYIEVHHLKPVADIGEDYLVHPVKDLRPVCANCHRMLHRARPAISIEELTLLLKSDRQTD